MDGRVIKGLDGDSLGQARVVFDGVIDGARMEVELELAGDPLAREGLATSFVVTGIRVRHAGLGRRLGWGGVTSALLRKVPVGKLAEDAGRLLIEDLRSRGSIPRRDGQDLAEVAKRGPQDDEVLRLVGELYAEALLQGSAPAKGIAQQMGLSPATATRWIRRSRDRGFIPALQSELRNGDRD